MENGRAEYDPEQAQACLAQLRELASKSCPSTADIEQIQRTVCAQVLEPKQTADEPCNEDFECVSDHCVEDEASACYGSCLEVAEPVGLGEVCGTSSCKDGLLCEPTTDPETGFDYRCIEPGTVEERGTCASSLACADGLICAGAGECLPLPSLVAEGESCDTRTTMCEPGLICADFDPFSGADPSGECEPPRQQGEQCLRSYECRPGLFCSPGASSAEMGTCEAYKKEGDVCPASTDDHAGGLHEACQDELRCVMDESSQEYRCVQPVPEDAPEICSAS